MKPGDKVICIDDKIDPDKNAEIRRDFEIWITKDKEYTIREILDNNGIVPGLFAG
jgi:succinyl-CoA synthetase beta subunit